MRFFIQILFLLLTWFNLSATPAFSNVALPSHAISFPKADNQNLESEIKIGIENFARSGISENSFSQKAICWESYVLENRAREGNVWGVKGAGDDLLNAFKPGFSKESILTIPKGSRPLPADYLKEEYIVNHLSKFDGGVTKITSYNPTGSVGPPGGTFVLPKSKADDLIQQAGGDVNKLEDLLGLNRGDLGATPYRIDVNNPSGLRMPSGNEPGANEFWIPGGKTSGGILETTVDQIQLGTYTKQTVF